MICVNQRGGHEIRPLCTVCTSKSPSIYYTSYYTVFSKNIYFRSSVFYNIASASDLSIITLTCCDQYKDAQPESTLCHMNMLYSQHQHYTQAQAHIDTILLLCFLAHAPLLEYRCTEVNRNIHNIGAPTFSIKSQNIVFQLQAHEPKSAIIRYHAL